MNIPAANIFNVKGTPYENVRFYFVRMTPEFAAELLKSNKLNRRLKLKTIAAYEMDMRNGAWQVTHQSLAFDLDGNLIDGQHRLHGVVKSKTTVPMLVSTGWPSATDKHKTMDAVDRGVQRSLADQLHLQHGIEPRDAGQVVRCCNSIASACMGSSRVRKATTDSILTVFKLYKKEIEWVLSKPVKAHGLRSISVSGCVAMGYALWPEKTEEFLHRLVTGENLSGASPILSLRNYLLGAGAREEASIVRQTIFHHLCAFVDGKSCGSVVTQSVTAYERVMKLSKIRTDKICKLYHDIVVQIATEALAEKKFEPLGDTGIELGSRLSKRFTTTDMLARVDDGVNIGQIVLVWMNHRWVVGCAPGTYEKTEQFGKKGLGRI